MSPDLTEPTWITGTGVISCAGANTEALWQSALLGRCGIVDGLGIVAAEVIKTPAAEGATGALAFALLAAKQAMHLAGWTKLNADDGLILATTTGQIPLWDQSLVGFLNGKISKQDFERDFVHQPLGVLLDSLCDLLGHDGRSFLVTSACAAGTQALAMAVLWLREKRVKRCLVVGAEVLCHLTIEGFRSLQLLSSQPATPFDRDRKGINLSEGAGALCLELDAQPKALACLSGFGLSTDGFHMTGPHPEGRGCFEAMAAALRSAGLKPQDISWAHAHGTGSPQNDVSEGLALSQLFGEQMPWVSSTKWIHGHALGASGTIETVLCIEALRHQTILKTGGLQNPDPIIPVRHSDKNIVGPLKHILKTTLGFGGINAALVLSQPTVRAASGLPVDSIGGGGSAT